MLLVVVALVVIRPWEEGGGTDTLPAKLGVRIVRAVDGDTLEVAFGGRREDVRLIGVDTPGDRQAGDAGAVLRPARLGLHPPRRRRPLGRGSSSASSAATSTAGCSPTPGSAPRFFNAMLLRRGLARTLTIPPNDRFAPVFHRIEMAAARAGRGLWDACPP